MDKRAKHTYTTNQEFPCKPNSLIQKKKSSRCCPRWKCSPDHLGSYYLIQKRKGDLPGRKGRGRGSGRGSRRGRRRARRRRPRPSMPAHCLRRTRSDRGKIEAVARQPLRIEKEGGNMRMRELEGVRNPGSPPFIAGNRRGGGGERLRAWAGPVCLLPGSSNFFFLLLSGGAATSRSAGEWRRVSPLEPAHTGCKFCWAYVSKKKV